MMAQMLFAQRAALRFHQHDVPEENPSATIIPGIDLWKLR